MPVYEYRCKNCNTIFEKLQLIGATNEGVTCPECHSSNPDRLFSAFNSAGLSGSANSGGSCGHSGSPFT